jgi:monoterpene epsilon-lactone hydrolase
MANEGRGRVLAFPQAPEAIELKQLRAFVAVADELNFGRAADRLHISQPALSRQVRALEQLLGLELLRRTKHRVELTIAGEALLDRARRLLDDVDEAVTATLAIGGELAGRLAQLWAPLLDLANDDADLEELRQAYERFHAQFSPPEGVAILHVNAGGVPALEFAPHGRGPGRILYLHGGGHAMGSAFGYRPLIGAIAVAAGTGAVAPEYRLAPEHPFPAALDDITRAYEWVISSGTRAEEVVVVGDSSGAGLAMSLLLRLREEKLPLPGGAVLFCPWLDLTGSTLRALVDPPEEVAVLSRQAAGLAASYLGDHPIDDPVVSPLRADLSGLPPLLVQAATGDAQREDAHQVTARARAHAVEARLELYPVETHAFQTFWSFLPEAKEALERAGQFIRGIVGAQQPSVVGRRPSARA